MFGQIESSHILKCNDYIKICYCLACKEEIDEDRICHHLLSFEHEDSKRALFKLSVPDQYCDSRDVKYLDIVNNCVFDVSWEIGSEASYVCKRDNHLVCLVCKEEIHNFNSISKVSSSLKHHLKSKSHLKNIRYDIPWVYHPNGSFNFISFYKSTVFCSFCQSYLESSSDTLLQTAADHLQIEKEHSDKNIIKEAFSSEEDGENSEYEEEEEEEATLFPASDSSVYVTKVLNNIDQSYELDYDGKDQFVSSNDKNQTTLLQDGVTETNIEIVQDFLCKTEKVNSVNENQKAHELANEVQAAESSTTIGENPNTITIAENPNKIIGEINLLASDHKALKKLTKSLIFKVNKAYIDKKDDEFFCTICQLSFEYSENGKYLRKHLYSFEHNSVLEQHALNYVTMVQNKKKIELPEQNENVNKFLAVLNDIARDNMFMSHVKYMTNNGKHFICLICDSDIPFTSCGKFVESHILRSKHLKKVFDVNNCAIIEQTESNYLNKKPENMFLEVIENLSKTEVSEASSDCNLSRSCLYDKVSANNCIEFLPKELTSTLPAENNEQDSVLSCKVDIDQSFDESITGISLDNVESSVIDRRQSQAWKKLQKKVWELGINSHFIGLKERNFFCELCQEAVKFSESGYRLVKHCTSPSHNKILIRKATDYVSSIEGESLITNSNESLHLFHNILLNFAKQFQNNEVIHSHLLFICVEEDKLFCMLCRKVMKTSVDSVKGHLFTNLHKKNVVDLNCHKNFLKKRLSHEVENGKVSLDSKSLQVGETGNIFTFKIEDTRSCEETKSVDQGKASGSDKTSQNSESFISKDELPCSECGELITIWNKETEFSMQLHLQKHKALLNMDDPHKQEFQENTDYVCPVCHVPITVFNKDIILSVDRHFEEFHRAELQSKTCVINSERYSVISHTQIFDNLPVHLKDHVNFINMKGENFFCKLCNCQLPPISDLTSGLEMLKTHFTDFFHETQFKLSLQSDSKDEFGEEIDDSCSLEDFSSNVTSVDRSPKINHIETMYFESKPEKIAINTSKKKVIPFECFAQQSGIWDYEKFTKTLVNHFARNNLALKLNSIFFSGKGDWFYCHICQEYISYDESGKGLKNHCNMQRHIDLIEISTDKFLSSLTESYSVLSKISRKLSSCIQMKTHLKFLTKIENGMFCLLCNKTISFNITQNDAKEHCCSEIHGQNTLELVMRSIGAPITTTKIEFNTTQSSTSKPRRKAVSSFEVHFTLWLLSTKHTIVKENITIIGEKSGKFHCKKCDILLTCNVKGKKLRNHLLTKHCIQPNNVKLSSVPSYFVGPLVDPERPSLSPISVLGSGSDTNPSQNVLDVTLRKTNVFERNICVEASEKIVKESCCNSEISNKKGLGISRTRSAVLTLLEKHASKYCEVRENINVIDEREGRFYCKVCDEVVLCSLSGSRLMDHLKKESHRQKMCLKSFLP